jgi:hypothetical protein
VNGLGSVSATWSVPSSNGGAAITSYSLGYKLESAGSYTLTSVSGTSGGINGLASGQTYDFEVAAHNSVGTGKYAVVTGVRIGPQAPTILTTPAASTYVTSASFTFIGAGNFQCALDAAAYAACASPKAYSGLSVATHAFHVRSLDSFGNASLVASFAWVVTKPPVPGAVSNLTAVMTTTKGKTTLSFSPGANATGYQLYYDCALGPNPDQNWIAITTGSSGGKRTFTVNPTKGAVNPGAKCFFRVRTVGIGGQLSAYVQVNTIVPSNW